MNKYIQLCSSVFFVAIFRTDAILLPTLFYPMSLINKCFRECTNNAINFRKETMDWLKIGNNYPAIQMGYWHIERKCRSDNIELLD